MGWKKMLIGEKMPDKDDPQYKQRYEDEVNAGRKFAQMTKIDKVAGKIGSGARPGVFPWSLCHCPSDTITIQASCQ